MQTKDGRIVHRENKPENELPSQREQPEIHQAEAQKRLHQSEYCLLQRHLRLLLPGHYRQHILKYSFVDLVR